jgi:sirohydrochlorin cobaltochelatase
MNTVVVLAMHGAPPNDMPRQDLAEYFTLHARFESSPVSHSPALESRYEELSEKVKNWPRTPANDPYCAASHELAKKLSDETGLEVKVGFNEFCAPGVEEVIAKAAVDGPKKIIVLTTMLTRGGEHSERDIAMAIKKTQERFPGVEIIYAWPYETADIARFLAEHLKKFENR